MISDLEAIAYLVNPGELFANAPHTVKNRLKEKDVYYIEKLGLPTGSNIDYLYKVFAHARMRVVASGVEDIVAWQKYIHKLDVVCMDIDDDTIMLDKAL